MKSIRYYLLFTFLLGFGFSAFAGNGGQKHRHKAQRHSSPALHDMSSGTQAQPESIKTLDAQDIATEETATASTAVVVRKDRKARSNDFWKASPAKSKKLQKKALRKKLKRQKKQRKLRKHKSMRSPHSGAYADGIICLIIGLFIPPLGAFLMFGPDIHFWVSLILTLLFYFPGWLYTLIVILMHM